MVMMASVVYSSELHSTSWHHGHSCRTTTKSTVRTITAAPTHFLASQQVICARERSSDRSRCSSETSATFDPAQAAKSLPTHDCQRYEYFTNSIHVVLWCI